MCEHNPQHFTNIFIQIIQLDFESLIKPINNVLTVQSKVHAQTTI
jgi:hypothetical protein